ncbi:solute carrier organic anion transporter family member 4C1-like [Anneissia japonica]|uniref:solute carrier organic anion transporter family member 4C1-like n=1 Tax=Anneissia japonica TaxID=1529436 RepID=UPI0014258BF1|nr:solute carrier organic anion transporter family member 4C1-like [Anneissia japonica]XP_033104018.1 solute carrier organic anion transporter family member 4C1-like [Anneissia japonica]
MASDLKMDEKNYNNSIKTNKNELLDSIPDSDGSQSCGFGSCTPNTLQKFATPRWLLCVICIFVFIQNIVTNGFVNVAITTLERRFDLSSSQAALISGSYDIGAGLGVVPVSYYCANRHKGKSLTAGLILFGFGSLIFSSPHYFAPSYSYDNGVNSSQTFCSVSDESEDSCAVGDDEGQSLSNYLYVFIVAQLTMGLAVTPLYTVGVAYLDENVKHKVIGAYIGIFLMVSILASALGFVAGGIILNNVYINIIKNSSSTPASSSADWMGAWWLGFVISAIFCFMSAIPMSCFPAHLPGYDEISKEKLEAARSKGEYDEVILVSRTDFGKWNDLPSATWNLLKNGTYRYLTLGACCQSMVLLGITVFLAKFLEVMFLLSPGTAGSVTGLFGTIFGALATILSGWAIRKWKMDIPEMLKMIMISAVIFGIVIFSCFLNCPEPPLVGISQPYDSSSSKSELISQCNKDCPCSDATYNAVCGSDGRVYFDACFAGCTEYHEQSKTFQNCSCILARDDNADQQSSATDGACATETCANLYLYLALFSIASACIFIPGPPGDTITLRCVPHSQRSLALAVQWLMLRCLGTIPGPFLIGSLFDGSCILWNENCDGSQGRCHKYDRLKLGALFVGVSVGLNIIGLVFYCLSYVSHKRKTPTKSEENLDVSTMTENTIL